MGLSRSETREAEAETSESSLVLVEAEMGEKEVDVGLVPVEN